jgi:hypothetical protein
MKKLVIIVIVAAAIIGGGIALLVQDAKNPNASDPFANKTSRELALMCEPTEYVVMHIHPTLTINIEGKAETIPANIGIEGVNGQASHEQASAQASCLHFLHTHDASGTLHVESPIAMEYHLSDFFAVWGQEFSKDQILNFKASDTRRVRMTVNGQESQDYGDLVLKDKDKIEIFYEAK